MEAQELIRNVKRHTQFRYLVFQSERGSSGTLHYQGYVEFKQPVAWTSTKELLYGAHVEKRRGTAKQAIAYCKKEPREDGPFELGEHSNPGGANGPDTLGALGLLTETRDITDVIEQYPLVFLKSHRGLERMLELTVEPRPHGIAPKCILLYGPTGTGKSHWANTRYPGAFWKSPLCKWFDGYLDQTAVIMDEFAGRMSKYGLGSLLRLMDKYPLKVEIKGSSRDFLATTIVFTTNIHPYLWYDWSNRASQWPALQRRFDEVWWFKERYFGDPTTPVYLDKESFFSSFYESCVETDSFYDTVTRPNTPLEISAESDEEEEMQVYPSLSMSRIWPVTRPIDYASSTSSEEELEQMAARSMVNLTDVFCGSEEEDPS